LTILVSGAILFTPPPPPSDSKQYIVLSQAEDVWIGLPNFQLGGAPASSSYSISFSTEDLACEEAGSMPFCGFVLSSAQLTANPSDDVILRDNATKQLYNQDVAQIYNLSPYCLNQYQTFICNNLVAPSCQHNISGSFAVYSCPRDCEQLRRACGGELFYPQGFIRITCMNTSSCVNYLPLEPISSPPPTDPWYANMNESSSPVLWGVVGGAIFIFTALLISVVACGVFQYIGKLEQKKHAREVLVGGQVQIGI